MRVKAVFVSAALLVSAFGAIQVFGCGGDDKTTTEPVRSSRKGEACQVTNDCAAGLACQPIPGGAGGLCVVGTFNISVTAKECALIECTVVDDCCPTAPANCPSLLQTCQLDAGITSQNACLQYDQLCKCDTTKRACESSKCVTHCSTDPECVTSGQGTKCSGGQCVQCALDTDCSNDQTCVNGRCQDPCQSDGDCAGFNRCVDGKCIDSGCQTDRECVAATRNVEATCGTDGKCIVPCQTDLECGNPKSYSFFSCINSQCTYTGCQSDKDCRLLFSGPSDASVLPPKEHVVCRDKATPGPTTVPAQ